MGSPPDRICQEQGKGLLVSISDSLSQKLTGFTTSLKNVKPVHSTHIEYRSKNYFLLIKIMCLKFKIALEI